MMIVDESKYAAGSSPAAVAIDGHRVTATE